MTKCQIDKESIVSTQGYPIGYIGPSSESDDVKQIAYKARLYCVQYFLRNEIFSLFKYQPVNYKSDICCMLFVHGRRFVTTILMCLA